MPAVDVARAFAPDPPSVAHARRSLRQTLQDHAGAAGRDLADTLVMAADELATNAVVHAWTGFTVRLLVDAARVRVEVTDEDSRVPQPCLVPDDATAGRGLAIVDTSGLTRGIERHAGGTTVWLQAALRTG